jgi:DNA-binding XRE family transcriptional regulator
MPPAVCAARGRFVIGAKVAQRVIYHKLARDESENVSLMRTSREAQPALGAAIRAVRAEREISQLDLAEGAELTVAHLSKLENGRVNPTWGTVLRVAAALGVTIAELAMRSEGAGPMRR